MKSLLFITNFYPDPQHGGIERVTNILAESFAEQGIICRCIYLYSCEVNLKWDYLPCQLISAQYDKQVYMSIYRGTILTLLLIRVIFTIVHFYVRCAMLLERNL